MSDTLSADQVSKFKQIIDSGNLIIIYKSKNTGTFAQMSIGINKLLNLESYREFTVAEDDDYNQLSMNQIIFGELDGGGSYPIFSLSIDAEVPVHDVKFVDLSMIVDSVIQSVIPTSIH